MTFVLLTNPWENSKSSFRKTAILSAVGRIILGYGAHARAVCTNSHTHICIGIYILKSICVNINILDKCDTPSQPLFYKDDFSHTQGRIQTFQNGVAWGCGTHRHAGKHYIYSSSKLLSSVGVFRDLLLVLMQGKIGRTKIQLRYIQQNPFLFLLSYCSFKLQLLRNPCCSDGWQKNKEWTRLIFIWPWLPAR